MKIVLIQINELYFQQNRCCYYDYTRSVSLLDLNIQVPKSNNSGRYNLVTVDNWYTGTNKILLKNCHVLEEKAIFFTTVDGRDFVGNEIKECLEMKRVNWYSSKTAKRTFFAWKAGRTLMSSAWKTCFWKRSDKLDKWSKFSRKVLLNKQKTFQLI